MNGSGTPVSGSTPEIAPIFTTDWNAIIVPKPTNKYLPPRTKRNTPQMGVEALPHGDGSAMDRLFKLADRLLSGTGN
jgi:hypothetical protein